MAVYSRELLRTTEKILQRMAHAQSEPVRILNQNYRLSDLVLLKQMALHEAKLSMVHWEQVLELRARQVRPALQRLLAAGALDRTRSMEDSRRYLIGLSDWGLKLCGEYDRYEEQLLDLVIRDLTVNEEKAVLKYLSRLNQRLWEKPRKGEGNRKPDADKKNAL